MRNAGETAEAIATLQAVVQMEGPLRSFAAHTLADIARETDDATLLRAALAAWAESERVPRVRVRAHRALGDHLVAVDRPADAVPAYAYWADHAENRRDRSRARWALASAHRTAGDTAQATPLLWKIVHDDPASVQARDALPLLPDTADVRKRYEIGRVHLKHRSWAKADAWLTPLIDAPLSTAFEAQVLYAWAEAQSRLHSYAEGRRAMYQLALAYPHSGYARKAWQSIASYWSRDKRYAQAIRAYDDVADHDPTHDAAVQALWDAAKLQMRTDPQAAAGRLGALQAAYPTHVLADDALRLQGLALYKHGAFTEARAVFRRGYTEYPRRRQADDCSYWEGKSALALGDVEAAREAFRRTRKQWPTQYYARRAAEQLAQLAAEQLHDESVRLVPASYVPSPAEEPQELYAEADMQLPAAADEWVSLLLWFRAHGLAEARDVIPQLRVLAETPAQKFFVAQLAADAGDFEACVWLADSVRKARRHTAPAPALARLLYPEAWFDHIREHAVAYDVDPYLPLAIMREESHFRDGVDSSAGARGVMQIMPATGRWLGRRVPEAGAYSHDRLYDVSYNIQLGTHYLGYLMERFDGNPVLATAAYNGGEGNVRKWVERYGIEDIDLFVESIPYDETNEYVKKVLGTYHTYRRLAESRTEGNDA